MADGVVVIAEDVLGHGGARCARVVGYQLWVIGRRRKTTRRKTQEKSTKRDIQENYGQENHE